MGITGTLLLYRFLQYAASPLVALYVAARLVSQREYWIHFGERLGFLPRSLRSTNPNSIWLHAVSAGEVASSAALIRELRVRDPEARIFVSTGTLAGRKTAERQLTALVDGIFYAPFDYASCVRRVLRSLRPALVLIVETEIWPNLYLETKRCGAGLVIVNARISDRSWPRYRQLSSLFAPVLLLPDWIVAQSETDRARYAQLGVDARKLSVDSNLKFDAAITGRSIELPDCGAEQIWIAASTAGPDEAGSVQRHDVDEDDIVIESFRKLSAEFPRLLLILAPRQPARFNAVAAKLRHAGVRYCHRTAISRQELPAVLLLDSMGELAGLYQRADVVFVGGSIAPRGGHNILEPAAARTAIIVGPHMENFQAIADEFLAVGAIRQIESADELTPAVRELLRHPEKAAELATRAYHVLQSRRGVAGRMADIVQGFYRPGFFNPPRFLLWRWLLQGLAWLWCKGGDWKRNRGEQVAALRGKLPVPVVSIGNVTVGGSGKTPFCDMLARELRRRGYRPGILTRGYRRRSPASVVALAAGAHVPTALTGDEAQIFLHSGNAAVGIGLDRFNGARMLLETDPGVNVLLLDDGFQHARMPRTLDIVLIDALDPFGGFSVVPLGRLREPLTALARADAFVITRMTDPRRTGVIRTVLQRYNAAAPIFTTRLLARGWRWLDSGTSASVPEGTRIAAFCGLGNAESFWATLRTLNLDVVFRWSFGDHHQYKPYEVQRLVCQARALGADLLVTTEKDAMNLPPNLGRLLAGVQIAWLKIDVELAEPEAFFAFIEGRLEQRSH